MFATIAREVAQWRKDGYPCEEPLIGEILRFQTLPGGELRFLREAQKTALETYWYLRLVKNTPHIMDLYREYHPKIGNFAKSLGIKLDTDYLSEDNTIEGLIRNIKDPEWAKARRIGAVYESAVLEYPGY